MKRRYSFWWVFCILSCLVTLANPRTGVIAAVYGLELFILGINYIVFYGFFKTADDYIANYSSKNQNDKPSTFLNLMPIGITICKVMFIFSGAVLFLIKTIAVIIIVLVNNEKSFSPFPFDVDNVTICLSLFGVAFVLNIIQFYYSIRFILSKKVDFKSVENV